MRGAISASEQAYRHVRELILDGKISAGEMITEGQIVGMLELSRTPVREAFLRLSSEGWLKLYPKRGALVVPVQPEEKEEILEARQLIETHAVTAVAREPDEARALAARLTENIQQMTAAMESEDLEAFATLDTEFHLLIVMSGENSILSDIYLGLRDRLRRMTTRSVWQDRTRMETILRDHTELSAIVARGDAASYSVRLMEHMRATHDKAHGRSARAAAALRATKH